MTLYRNYTVVVQTSTAPYEPNNDLELLLYEGRLELKPDPNNSGAMGVFSYGTTTLATPVYIHSITPIPATAFAADVTNRPGEYDFLEIDLNKAGTASYAGETLYSVIGRPAGDTDFEHASVIIDNTDISDPNIKQLVRASTGDTGTLTDNIFYAGGTVTYTVQPDISGTLIADAENRFLALGTLPDVISTKYELVSVYPAYAKLYSGQGKKLIARFDVHYTDAAGAKYAFWNGIPAFESTEGSWVIHLTHDQYNQTRSEEFSVLDLRTLTYTVSINEITDHVFIRSFGLPPKITTTPTAVKEQVGIHGFLSGTDRIVGIGDWSYSAPVNTPAYNLDVTGTLGMRLRVSGVSRISITPTATLIGIIASNYLSATSLGMTGIISGSAMLSLTASGFKAMLSSDTTSLAPMAYADTAVAALSLGDPIVNTGATYIKLEAGNAIRMQVYDGVSATTQAMYVTSGLARFGCDLTGGSGASYMAFDTSSTTIKAGGTTVFYADATSVHISSVSASGYPAITASDTQVFISGSASTSVEANSSDEVNIWFKPVSSGLKAFTASRVSGTVEMGYDVTTYPKIKAAASLLTVYGAATVRMEYGATTIVGYWYSGSQLKFLSVNEEELAAVWLGYDVTNIVGLAQRGAIKMTYTGVTIFNQDGEYIAMINTGAYVITSDSYIGPTGGGYSGTDGYSGHHTWDFTGSALTTWKIPFYSGDSAITALLTATPAQGSMAIGVATAGTMWLYVYSSVTGWKRTDISTAV